MTADALSPAEIADYASADAKSGLKPRLYTSYSIPLLINLYASKDRIETALGMSADTAAGLIYDNLHTDVPPVFEESSDFIRLEGIHSLPMPRFYDDSSGSVNMGCVIYEGFRAGVYRIEPVSGNKAVIHCKNGSGLAEYAGRGRGITVAVGCSPLLFLTASGSVGGEALKIAGRLGTKYTATERFPVPSDTNVIIQGVLTGETAECGRFFNYTCGYSLPEPCPVMEIESVSIRRNGVFQSTVTGIPPMESAYIGVAASRVHFYRLRAQFPQIIDIEHPLDGVFWQKTDVFCSEIDANLEKAVRNDRFYGKFEEIRFLRA